EERRAEEDARFQLLDHDVLGLRRDVRNDGVAVLPAALRPRTLGGAAVLPIPRSPVPVVVAAYAGAVDHRQSPGARRREQPFDRLDALPSLGTAGVPPALDRFKDRLGPVAAERVVHVDDEDRRPVTEALARRVSSRRENLLVALGEKFVPDGLAHGLLLTDTPAILAANGAHSNCASLDPYARLAHHAAVAGVLRGDVGLELLRLQIARLDSPTLEEALHCVERKDAPNLPGKPLHDRLRRAG